MYEGQHFGRYEGGGEKASAENFYGASWILQVNLKCNDIICFVFVYKYSNIQVESLIPFMFYRFCLMSIHGCGQATPTRQGFQDVWTCKGFTSC